MVSLKLNSLISPAGNSSTKKRVGRGIGSGSGKTAGRGHKGQKSRSGGFHKIGFEGGQMPLQRRLPKRGFTSRNRKSRVEIRLAALQPLVESERVSLQSLKKAGLVGSNARYVKVINSGKISRKIVTEGLLVTSGARAAIEFLGGECLD